MRHTTKRDTPRPAGAGPVLVLPALMAGLAGLQGCDPLELPGRDARPPDNILVLPKITKLMLNKSSVQSVQYTACVADATATATDKGAVDSSTTPGDAGAPCPAGQRSITDKVEWTVEQATLGSFDEKVKGRFSTQVMENGKLVPARHGGKTRIKATYAGTLGAANLEVVYVNVFYAGKATAASAKKFGSTKKSGSIAIHYPPNKVLVPPNLGQMELQYSASITKTDLFLIKITSALSQIHIFTTDPHFHNLDLKQWQAVGLTNKGLDVTMEVLGTNAASPGYISSSPKITLHIADNPVRGGLYYWDTSEPVGIYRYDFEKPTESAEAYYTRDHAKDCIGCHALSRGGEKVAFTKSGGNGMTDIFSVETRKSIVTPSSGKYRGDIQTFGPDGKEIIVVHQGKLRRRSALTGAQLELIPTSSFGSCKTSADCKKAGESCLGVCTSTSLVCSSSAVCPKDTKGKPGVCASLSCQGAMATHPDWSEKGDMLTYVSVAYKDYHLNEFSSRVADDVHFHNGSIYIIRTNKEGKWTAPTLLVKGGGGVNLYYPTFSPGSGDWIAFNRSTGDSYSDEDATIYIVSPDWDPTGKRYYKDVAKKVWINEKAQNSYNAEKPRALSTSVNAPKMSNSWPRWSPFMQVNRSTAKKDVKTTIYWLTFSSVRDYGLRLRNSKVSKYKERAPQVWMVAFDAGEAVKGNAPTPWPVFWLPFQSVKHHNHIAQWTQKVMEVQ